MFERICSASAVVMNPDPATEILSRTYIETVVCTAKDINIVHRRTIRLVANSIGVACHERAGIVTRESNLQEPKAPRQARGTIRLVANSIGVACHERAGIVTRESNGGGGGNRTPVRRFSVKYDYMLSRCFDLAPRAPSGWVSRNYPVWLSASSPPAGESAHPTE